MDSPWRARKCRRLLRKRLLPLTASMGQSETSVAALCQELGITRQTLYRHVSPTGQLREDGRKLLAGS